MNLRPCPFCGGNPTLRGAERDLFVKDYAIIECDDCGASLDFFSCFKTDGRMTRQNQLKEERKNAKRIDKEIIKKWNKRV